MRLPPNVSRFLLAAGLLCGAATLSGQVASPSLFTASCRMCSSGGGGGAGTVTSVGISVPPWLAVANVPITNAGTAAITSATGLTPGWLIGTCGSATTLSLCALTAGMVPTLNQSTTGNAATSTALAANPANCSAGSVAAGVDATGAAEGCAPLPVNTSATASSFFSAYSSGTGAFTKARPACADLSDASASCATDATNASNLSAGTVPLARLSVFGASGGSHAAGIVPDPGSSSGTTRFLREDATWSSAGGGGLGGSTGSTDSAILTASGTGGATVQAPSGSADAVFNSTGSIGLGGATNSFPGIGKATDINGHVAVSTLRPGDHAAYTAAIVGELTITDEQSTGTGATQVLFDTPRSQATYSNSWTIGWAAVSNNPGVSNAADIMMSRKAAHVLTVDSATKGDSLGQVSLGEIIFTPQAAAPFACSGPTEGALYWNGTNHVLCMCNGTGWLGIAGALGVC